MQILASIMRRRNCKQTGENRTAPAITCEQNQSSGKLGSNLTAVKQTYLSCHFYLESLAPLTHA